MNVNAPRTSPSTKQDAAKQPAAKPKPAGAAAEAAMKEQAAPVERTRSGGSGTGSRLAATVISTVVHSVVLLSMALIVSEPPRPEAPRIITSSAVEAEEEFEETVVDIPEEPPTESSEPVTDVFLPAESTTVENVEVVSTADDIDAAPVAVEFTEFGAETAPASDLMASIGAVGGKAGGLGGRKAGQTGKIAAASGGGKDTETAVDNALKWLIEHQLPDGGWSFDLTKCPNCQGACSHSAAAADIGGDRSAATSMALLPFLGRGYTHREGPYKQQINAGLAFLAQMAVKGQGKAYGRGGSLYSQGLAGIVLSEAFAMTQDNQLAMPAQLTLNYIMYAQDPVGGGWKYAPKQRGDTSVVGWQLMALKSGHMAYLEVNPHTIKKTIEFLDSVQGDEGASYGYEEAGENHVSTTAVGLLCRMYLGWKKDHPALVRGVDALAKRGPNKHLYYDYYATQVMHHMEGDRWVAWNEKMKGILLPAQSKTGHEAGSWWEGVEKDAGSLQAGRLYCTSLATLILEVYYRHMPIYRNASVDAEFKE